MEEDLLGDLIAYGKSKDKRVMSAARGLLQLYREVNPGMLKRRERGITASMGLAQGTQPVPFGYAEKPVVDIEGLVLLEDHLRTIHGEDKLPSDGEEGDEKAWGGWELEVSNSEDEDKKSNGKPPENVGPSTEANRTSTFATTKILTPTDFSLINDMQIQAAAKAVESGGGSATKRKLASLEAAKKAAFFFWRGRHPNFRLGKRHSRPTQEGEGRLRGAHGLDGARPRGSGKVWLAEGQAQGDAKQLDEQ
ncbi:SDA1-domain-containing protein [Lactarius psammicola]|nr:SDA1-domain-containing protein [Lactarius psammicola]